MDQTLNGARMPSRPRAKDAASAVLIVLLTLWMAFQASKTIDPIRSDTMADWITAKAAMANLSLFRDIHDLGAALGVDYQSPAGEIAGMPIVHPRSPAAVLLLAPLTLANPESVHLIVTMLNVASFLAMSLWITPRLCGVSVSEFVIPLAALTCTFSFFQTLHWGGVSGLVALLTVASWYLSGSGAPGGAWVGIATAFKLYPGLTVVPLLARPSRAPAGWTAISVFLVLNLVGAVVMGISLLDSAKTLFEGGSTWLPSAGNQSLPGFLVRAGLPVLVVPVIVMAGIVSVWIVSRHRPFDQAMALSFALAVVISPLSWGAYDMLVMPVVLMLWTLRSRWAPFGYMSLGWIIGNAGIGIVAAYGLLDQFLWVLLPIRIAIVLTIALSPARVWSRGRSLADQATT